MKDRFSFKEGDVVEYAGLRGVVVKDTGACDVNDYPILVSLFNQGDRHELFTRDGRMDVRDKFATLELVERPRSLEIV